MMKVSGVKSTDSISANQTGMGLMDSVSKSIQKQIANAQKQLQDLSSNEEMPAEEKMKKRQEIQKTISDLNNQLRQHQIEVRQEKQQAKKSSSQEEKGIQRKGSSEKTGRKQTGLSQASMQAMISADTSMKQAQVQGGVAAKMEGKANVLETEIKLDSGRGASVEKKQEELAETKQKMQDAEASQISSLADANQAVEEAAKSDQTVKEKEDSKKEKKSESALQEDGKDQSVSDIEKEHLDTEGTTSETTIKAKEEIQQGLSYIPIDIRL